MVSLTFQRTYTHTYLYNKRGWKCRRNTSFSLIYTVVSTRLDGEILDVENIGELGESMTYVYR